MSDGRSLKPEAARQVREMLLGASTIEAVMNAVGCSRKTVYKYRRALRVGPAAIPPRTKRINAPPVHRPKAGGVSPAERRLLNVLKPYIATGRPVTTTELADALDVSLARINQIIRSLIDKDLLRRNEGNLYVECGVKPKAAEARAYSSFIRPLTPAELMRRRA